MSKIGRKYINTEGVQVEIKPDGIHYSGKHASGIHIIPAELQASIPEPNHLLIGVGDTPHAELSIKVKQLWGLHRALLASAIRGALTPFERVLEIKGLGFKAVLRGTTLEFSLGYSHKKNFELPAGITADVDKKTGQKITLTGSNKELLGLVASKIRAFRKPEPYKGTGIAYAGEKIRRKAGKTK